MALPKLIPREVLLGLPEVTNPKISPDGRKIAYLKRTDDVLNIWLKDEKGERQLTFEKERSIVNYIWAENSRHIIYMKDYDGDENWHIYRIDTLTGKIKDLTPFEGVQASILRAHPSKPDEILIQMNKRDPSVHDVYRLNLQTGEMNLEMENPGNLMTALGLHGWVTDRNLKIRAGHFICDDGSVELRILEKGEWKPVLKWSPEESLFSTCIEALSEDEFYILDAINSPTYRISVLNVKTGEKKEVISDPDYDCTWWMLFHPYTDELLAVCIYKEKANWVAVSEKVKEDIEFLNNELKGDYAIISQNTDNNIWVIEFTKDDTPTEFYLYRRDNKKLEFLFSTQPELKKYTLSNKMPVFIRTRDGYKMLCYLTFPEGLPRKNLPMVLKVHGGPWSRDFWRFDPVVQWLANRGYLCLQVNFRGSMGFGKEFLNAGDREWGGKMQDDLVDSVKWCIENGYADPERIAIMGASYGGYAALCGATFTPDLFKCAISVCGPSNLITFLKSIPPYWKTYWAIFRKRIGDPDKEAEFLKSRSPYFHADKIKIPLLIAQGANDPRVNREESEQIVKALRERGKEVEYLLFENEGHGLLIQENRLKFYESAEKFLAKHLGGRCEEIHGI